MSQQITPPQPQPKRKHIFSVRLTVAEREAIQQLARQMNVSPSHLARHFLMQAVAYYANHREG